MSGTTLRNMEIATLEHISTPIVASPMLMPFIAELVVPSVGHIPNNRTNIGLFLIADSSINFNLFIILALLIFFSHCTICFKCTVQGF